MMVSDQGRVFLAMMLCGAWLGAVQDMLCVLRRGSVTTAAADILFGLIAAASVIAAGLLLACDVFRLYVLAGLLCGVALYQFGLGTVVRILKERLRSLSKKVKI